MDITNQIASQTFGQWNFILVIIFFCSVIAVAIFIERLRYFKKIDIDSTTFLIRMRKAIEDHDLAAAIETCDESRGAISSIVKAGLAKHNRPRDQIEGAMELRGLIEIAKMEKNSRVLSIIAHIAPLIGLLGTVIGFIRAFGEMRMSNLVEISAHHIGQAMEYALVTTAAGLVVAIPAVLGYNYLVSRIETMTVELQATAAEVVDLLISKQENQLLNR